MQVLAGFAAIIAASLAYAFTQGTSLPGREIARFIYFGAFPSARITGFVASRLFLFDMPALAASTKASEIHKPSAPTAQVRRSLVTANAEAARLCALSQRLLLLAIAIQAAAAAIGQLYVDLIDKYPSLHYL